MHHWSLRVHPWKVTDTQKERGSSSNHPSWGAMFTWICLASMLGKGSKAIIPNGALMVIHHDIIYIDIILNKSKLNFQRDLPLKMLLMEEILHQLITTLFYRLLYIPGGAGFLPSTVGLSTTNKNFKLPTLEPPKQKTDLLDSESWLFDGLLHNHYITEWDFIPQYTLNNHMFAHFIPSS